MTAALHPLQGVKLKTVSGGSYQKPLKSFGDLTFETQYCTGFAINLSANSPPVSCSTSEDLIGFDGGENFYSFVDNDPISYIDPKGLKEECKAQGSEVLDTDVSVNSFSREKFSLRLNFGGVSLFKWKVEASLIARLKCNFVCNDECKNQRKYTINTSKTYRNITEYLSGPGYKLTRFGYLYRFFSTLGENNDTYLKDYFEKILKQKGFQEPNADSLCNSIFNH